GRNAYACGPRHVNWDLAGLLSDEHAARRASWIDPARSRTAQAVSAAGGDTTYLCIVDRDGMAVSLVHSLSAGFGAGVTVPGTGILLNNRAGRGFALAEGHPNRIAPRKRTMSTLNCYLVTRNGKPAWVGGTPGGDGQIQWNLQLLNRVLDHGQDPQAAVAAPRWTHGPTTDPWTLDSAETLTVEDRVPDGTIPGLARRGPPGTPIGSRQAGGPVQVIAGWAGGWRGEGPHP